MLLLVFPIVLFAINAIASATGKGPIAQTNYGAIEGTAETLSDGSTVNVFLGIPFAQPPVGELRLEKPQPPKPWQTPLQAKSYPTACTPLSRKYLHMLNAKADEDCLYLNLFAPQTPSTNPNGYPVLVWIHGGAFAFGSTAEYGHGSILEHFVKRGIIVVMIQYRCGPLGFAAGGDADFAGNYGLWDQRAALLFVKDNIAAFGGDPARTTVWGESAGAASVSSLSLSTRTNDLFHQAIQNSGSAYGEWAHSNRTVKYTSDFAEFLNCSTNYPQDLKTCFKKATVDSLLDAGDHLGTPIDLEYQLFAPRPDGDFFDKPIDELLIDAEPKPSIIGLASDEFVLFALIEGHLSQLPTFNDNSFIEMVNNFVPPSLFGSETDEVRQKIIDFYLKPDATETTAIDNLFYFNKYIELGSDFFFNIPVITELQAKTKANWPVYTYLTTYSNKAILPEAMPFKKPTHAYELFYIFNRQLLNKFVPDENDAEFTRILVETMAEFVKTGNPSIEGVSWPKTVESEYLELKPYGPEIKHGLFKDSFNFWTKLGEEYDFDLVKGLHKTLLKTRDEL
uniref:COesterase domain-containing protein n=1 Tax=Panagrellus redivivus TaxID=6233 RepID=A0A7E4VHJ8_PANRE